MSNKLTKNFHQCFSKIRCLPTSHSPPLTLDDDEYQLKFEKNHPNNNNTVITINNSNVLYDEPSTSSLSSTNIIEDVSMSCSSSSATESLDFSAILASQRLFVASPGKSNSILDSMSVLSATAGDRVMGAGVPIMKYSPNPFADFRLSMQEMIESWVREKESKKCTNQDDYGKDNNDDDDLLEYLQELLLCYFNLNPKHTHKFIIEAFADVLVCLMST